MNEHCTKILAITLYDIKRKPEVLDIFKWYLEITQTLADTPIIKQSHFYDDTAIAYYINITNRNFVRKVIRPFYQKTSCIHVEYFKPRLDEITLDEAINRIEKYTKDYLTLLYDTRKYS